MNFSGWNPRKGKLQDFHEVQESSFFEISKFAGFRPQLFFVDFFRGITPARLFFKNAREARRVLNCSAHTQYMSANLRWLPEVLVFFCFSYPRVVGAGQKKDPPGYYNTEPDRVSRNLFKLFFNFFIAFYWLARKNPYNVHHEKRKQKTNKKGSC